jgi:hypothetical protein
MSRRPRLLAFAGSTVVAAFVALAGPATALAHQLSVTYESRLPLAVYLAGAAITVGLSFAFVLLRDVRAGPPAPRRPAFIPPAPLRWTLRLIGIVAWTWIIAQGIAGGVSNSDVATLFLWVYGWVGLAFVSAFIGPAWHWIDPFSSLHDAGAWVLRRLRVRGWTAATYPERAEIWPAVVGMVFVIWLELVGGGFDPRTLFIVLAGYTAFTLAMMAQFGRDQWRSHGEVFTVWFRLLGRLAHWALVDEAGDVRSRPFASGLLEGGWTRLQIAMIALGTGGILFDGLAQTDPWFRLFGAPGVAGETLLLVGFLGVIVGAALLVSRMVGVAATGAGILPIAVGYLTAHYLTYVLIDGQRIIIAISDPLQQGQNYFGTAFYEPSGAVLPPGLVWTLQLAAVVGGHMLGAWAGHVVAAREAVASGIDRVRGREVPLAVIMVALTTLTLWSLGQALVVPPADSTASAVSGSPGARQAGTISAVPALTHSSRGLTSTS